MFCLSELIKADMWWRKSWNTNKLRPNKCHFFSFVFARHAAANRRLECPRQGEKGRETNFAQAWQRARQNALNLSCTIGCLLFREQRKKAVFSCKVCALSDSTSSLKTHRESDCRVARMSICQMQMSSSIHSTFCLCAFSFCSTPPSPPTYSHILIHPVRFADSIPSWGSSATVSCQWMSF